MIIINKSTLKSIIIISGDFINRRKTKEGDMYFCDNNPELLSAFCYAMCHYHGLTIVMVELVSLFVNHRPERNTKQSPSFLLLNQYSINYKYSLEK